MFCAPRARVYRTESPLCLWQEGRPVAGQSAARFRFGPFALASTSRGKKSQDRGLGRRMGRAARASRGLDLEPLASRPRLAEPWIMAPRMVYV